MSINAISLRNATPNYSKSQNNATVSFAGREDGSKTSKAKKIVVTTVVLGAAAALAYAFRGKIAANPTVQKTIEKFEKISKDALAKAKEYAGQAQEGLSKAWEKLSKEAESAIEKLKNLKK